MRAWPLLLVTHAHLNMRIIGLHSFMAHFSGSLHMATDTNKRAVNLTINAKTLDMARDLGMNLSQTVDSFLTAEVQRRYWERWNADNQQAIAAYNNRIEREGLPLAKYRSF